MYAKNEVACLGNAGITQKNMKTRLVISTLDMAIKLRGVAKGLIFHSDRGSQYRSNDFVARLKNLSSYKA